MGSVGLHAASYSSSVTGSNAYHLRFTNGELGPQFNYGRASGLQVRCLQE